MSDVPSPKLTAPETLPPALASALAVLRRHAGGYALFSAAIALLMLAPTVYMLQVYDRVLASRNATTLAMLTLLVLGLLGLLAALEAIRGALGVRLAAVVQQRLAPALFDAALQRRPGASATRLAADVATLRQFVAGPLPAALFDLPLATLFVVAAFLFHVQLGLFVCATIVLVAGLAAWQERRLAPALAAARRAAGESGQALDETARQAETVQALGMAEALRARWAVPAGEAVAQQQAADARAAAASALLRGCRLAAQSGALGLGAWLVLQQQISAGMMIATGVLLGRALAPVEVLVTQARGLAALLDSWRRLRAALPRAAQQRQLELPVACGELQAEGLVVRAGDKGQALLHGVSLQLAPGRTLALLGASGAGKSTLARLLAGAATADAGTVRLDGAELDNWPTAQRAAAIGWLPQEVHLFAGTVAENIARMGEVDDAAVVRAAQAAGVHELILRLPEGYRTRLGADGVRLSGGQRQRIALARALYGEPVLLVLDEPDAHLDEPGEQALRQALQRHRERGGSAVIVSHRRALLDQADEALVLQGGRVAAHRARPAAAAGAQGEAALNAAPALRRA